MTHPTQQTNNNNAMNVNITNNRDSINGDGNEGNISSKHMQWEIMTNITKGQ
jgi:hypothetical protein